MSLRNQVQLITYPDGLGGNLPALAGILDRFFPQAFGGIHILPPFPSTGDRGFAPVTYDEIDPRFGRWADIRRLGEQYDLLVDLMVNHISRHSVYFQDFVANGRQSPYAELFLTLDKVWPGGTPDPADVQKIFLRRPEHPFADVQIQATGETERIWATFGTRDSSEQIDLDVRSEVTRDFFRRTFAHLSGQGVNTLRLDAIAFTIKKPGTSCFFVEPEIYEFMDWAQKEADRVGLHLLPEVHAHHAIQSRLEQHGFWVYNFVLPLLVLHTLQSQDASALTAHLRSSPRRQITLLDCHDGIPVLPDIQDVLPFEDARRVVERCLGYGANVSRIYSKDQQPGGFDAHQINCAYFSALGKDEDAYLAARAIQFFAPGIPQVYYVGLLAGENDPGEVERTGERRAINRRNFTVAEVEVACQKPVVQRLLRLIRFRNEYPAFDGEFAVLQAGEGELRLGWTKGENRCELRVDLVRRMGEIEYLDRTGQPVRLAL